MFQSREMDSKVIFKNRIKEIYVENLFGYYTYTIPKRDAFDKDSRHLYILYGDNGAGKTTILELIYYILSSKDGDGSKSKIANIKFTQFKITLENNIQIIAKREEPIVGAYDFVVKRNDEILYSVPLIPDRGTGITFQGQDPEIELKFRAAINFIKELKISVFFLKDDRNVLSNSDRANYSENEFEDDYYRKIDGRRIRKKASKPINELEVVIKNLENWIRQKVISATRQGEKNTNTVYDDIIKRINKSTGNDSDLRDNSESLKNELVELRKRSFEYSKMGFISEFKSIEMEKSLINTKRDDKLQVIYNVIEPYVEGLQTRLDSLAQIQNVVSLFTDTVNSYLRNKDFNFNLSSGFNIKHKNSEEPIEFDVLSSGERQLLLLLCNVITATEEATIFIIDEPEISLNVKWQRKLGNTLTQFSEGKNVQFILASHSIELLSGHKESVFQLINEKEEVNDL